MPAAGYPVRPELPRGARKTVLNLLISSARALVTAKARLLVRRCCEIRAVPAGCTVRHKKAINSSPHIPRAHRHNCLFRSFVRRGPAHLAVESLRALWRGSPSSMTRFSLRRQPITRFQLAVGNLLLDHLSDLLVELLTINYKRIEITDFLSQ